MCRINFNIQLCLILKQRFSIRPFMRSRSIADMLTNQIDMVYWSKERIDGIAVERNKLLKIISDMVEAEIS